jgi:hypothetical protein
MRRTVTVLLLFAASVATAQTATSSDSEAIKRAADYLAQHHKTPEEYVVSKFNDHDIVFLGELPHGVKQNLLFLQKLIPRLYKAGVRNLGFEMLEADDQAAADALINAPVYDNEKALELEFHWNPASGWAFQEYADVFRAAWQLNHNLPKKAPRFRIIGLDMRPDWSQVKPGENFTDRPSRWSAWMGSNPIARNAWMVKAIEYEFMAKHLKALVYDGASHITLSPTRDDREETKQRFSSAYALRRKYGSRITSIEMHSAPRHDRVTSAVVAALPQEKRIIGYDLKGTPVGDLPLTDAVAKAIVSDKKDLTVGDYTSDGAVQVALAAEPVTPAEGFITDARVERAKRDGYLPNIPEVTADSILRRQKMVAEIVQPRSAP